MSEMFVDDEKTFNFFTARHLWAADISSDGFPQL